MFKLLEEYIATSFFHLNNTLSFGNFISVFNYRVEAGQFNVVRKNPENVSLV